VNRLQSSVLTLRTFTFSAEARHNKDIPFTSADAAWCKHNVRHPQQRLTAQSGLKALAPDAWNFKRSGCIQIKRNQVDEGKEGKKKGQRDKKKM